MQDGTSRDDELTCDGVWSLGGGVRTHAIAGTGGHKRVHALGAWVSAASVGEGLCPHSDSTVMSPLTPRGSYTSMVQMLNLLHYKQNF